MSEAIDIGKRAEYIYKNSYKEIMETQEKRGGRRKQRKTPQLAEVKVTGDGV